MGGLGRGKNSLEGVWGPFFPPTQDVVPDRPRNNIRPRRVTADKPQVSGDCQAPKRPAAVRAQHPAAARPPIAKP